MVIGEGEFANITLTEAIDDLKQAHNMLSSFGYLKVGYLGISFGGCVALNVSSMMGSKVECVLAVCPISDYPAKLRWQLGEDKMQQRKESGFRLYMDGNGIGHNNNYQFYEDGFLHIIDEDKAKKIVSPLMIIHGDEDEDAPVEQSLYVAKLIAHCDCRIVQGAGHTFYKKEQKELVYGYAANFFTQNLL